MSALRLTTGPYAKASLPKTRPMPSGLVARRACLSPSHGSETGCHTGQSVLISCNPNGDKGYSKAHDDKMTKNSKPTPMCPYSPVSWNKQGNQNCETTKDGKNDRGVVRVESVRNHAGLISIIQRL